MKKARKAEASGAESGPADGSDSAREIAFLQREVAQLKRHLEQALTGAPRAPELAAAAQAAAPAAAPTAAPAIASGAASAAVEAAIGAKWVAVWRSAAVAGSLETAQLIYGWAAAKGLGAALLAYPVYCADGGSGTAAQVATERGHARLSAWLDERI